LLTRATSPPAPAPPSQYVRSGCPRALRHTKPPPVQRGPPAPPASHPYPHQSPETFRLPNNSIAVTCSLALQSRSCINKSCLKSLSASPLPRLGSCIWTDPAFGILANHLAIPPLPAHNWLFV